MHLSNHFINTSKSYLHPPASPVGLPPCSEGTTGHRHPEPGGCAASRGAHTELPFRDIPGSRGQGLPGHCPSPTSPTGSATRQGYVRHLVSVTHAGCLQLPWELLEPGSPREKSPPGATLKTFKSNRVRRNSQTPQSPLSGRLPWSSFEGEGCQPSTEAWVPPGLRARPKPPRVSEAGRSFLRAEGAGSQSPEGKQGGWALDGAAGFPLPPGHLKPAPQLPPHLSRCQDVALQHPLGCEWRSAGTAAPV